MGILRADRIAGLGGANAITGSVNFTNDGATGTGDYLRVNRKDNSDFNLSTNDFTIEFWMYSRNVGSSLHPVTFAASSVSSSSDAGFYVRQFGGVVQGYCFEGNNSIGVVATGTISNERWYHIAYVRSGSTFTMYLDGTSTATASSAEAVNFNAGWNLNIGSAYTNVYHYNGYLSNLRIINGTALYTSNFTPNTRLTNVANTVLLACQSSGNVLQEGTNKNIHLVQASGDNAGPEASRFTPNSPVGFSTTTDVGSQYGITFEDNTRFDTLSYMVPPGGNTRERNRGRALIAGGSTPSVTTAINFLNIQSSGRSIDFGDLTHGRYDMSGCSSGTRGVFAGGRDPAGNELDDTIDFVTIATTANATDFGNLTASRGGTQGAVSNGTRGIWGGGFEPSQVNKIEFVTIATTSNATDFGDLTVARNGCGRAMSTTRGLFGGGGTPSAVNTIDFITMATTGNATDYGDLTATVANSVQGTSSNTRGIFGGMGPNFDTIDFVTIATTGNATDFGDLVVDAQQRTATGNTIRGIFMGGYISPTGRSTIIDQIEIATTGSAASFGDLLTTTSFAGSTSDSHGGLS